MNRDDGHGGRDDEERRGAGFQEVRQWTLSVEYGGWPRGVEEVLGQLMQALFSGVGEPEEAPAGREEAPAGDELVSYFVCLLREVGTGLWRVREKMVDRAGEPLPEMGRAYRHLSALFDTLEQAGVRIQGHTDERVPEGGVYALKAVAYEQKRGLACERVVETLKPTIYFGGRIIQMGEVVIGTPAPDDRPE
jgi:hypothetical protein